MAWRGLRGFGLVLSTENFGLLGKYCSKAHDSPQMAEFWCCFAALLQDSVLWRQSLVKLLFEQGFKSLCRVKES